ncbi:class I SAM-dependent DNA methyltransferase [Psychromonas ossibalaenae]|uniref:class I SAM-dependent DNA methyltransferase n=1 Tax=Psychromonas ossibalaenae TaxID=444922 RepID=UPI00037E7801|nr:class I SAM-dependent methyltransferase [Psychromonas ossibalaenae]
MKSLMYSEHAEKYDSAVQDNIYNACLERPSLQAMLNDLAGLNVLDLGCGSGVYTQLLIEQGAAEITCIDVSEKMIQIVDSKFGSRVSSYSQDLSIGLPQEEPNSKDVIICPLVIHYIEDLCVLFQAVNRVLKAGGYMVFSTHHPLADFECSRSGNYFERELITDVWDTVGEPVEVVFYRRSLTEIMDAVTKNGLAVTQLSEGKVADKVKEISMERYNYLSKNPNFIFIKCQKLC